MKAIPTKNSRTKTKPSHQLAVAPADPQPLPPKRLNMTTGRVHQDIGYKLGQGVVVGMRGMGRGK